MHGCLTDRHLRVLLWVQRLLQQQVQGPPHRQHQKWQLQQVVAMEMHAWQMQRGLLEQCSAWMHVVPLMVHPCMCS